MQTTAMFVEQVLIGGMVLAAFLLPSHEWLQASLEPTSTAEAIWQGAVLVGMAYLLGIVADRAIDTLFSKLERWSRLQFALDSTTSYGPGRDRFPEGKLRTIVLTVPGLSEYGEYLRIRIRLSRAIAVLAPALAGAGVLAAIEDLGPRRWWGLWFVAVYAIAIVARDRWPLWIGPDKSKNTKKKDTQDPRDDVPAGTFSGSLWEVPLTSDEALDRFRDRAAQDRGLLVALGVLALSEAVAAAWLVHPWVIAVPLAGAGVSLLAGLTWSRILTTFYRHLENSFRFYVHDRLGR